MIFGSRRFARATIGGLGQSGGATVAAPLGKLGPHELQGSRRKNAAGPWRPGGKNFPLASRGAGYAPKDHAQDFGNAEAVIFGSSL